MIKTAIKGGFGVLLLALVFLIPSSAVEARHNSSGYGYSSSLNKKINALDNDEVEEFAIPILFGVKLSNMFPNFGDPRDGGARTHEGQDIMGKQGTPIVTPTEAVVVGTGNGDSSGKYVRTANPGGETFVYMHLDEIANIKSGDVLKVGDFIGTVGDTGNAQGGPAHLHFEVRKGKATDPYPRIEEEFTLKEKMAFVVTMFKDLDDEKEMAEFLVANYKNEFRDGLNAGYSLPKEIIAELKKNGIVDTSSLAKQLGEIIDSIPKVVTKELRLDSQGAEVRLVQMYLIYKKTGPQAEALGRSGATGYFGTVTQQALMEYQKEHDIETTGVYDAKTRAEMSK